MRADVVAGPGAQAQFDAGAAPVVGDGGDVDSGEQEWRPEVEDPAQGAGLERHLHRAGPWGGRRSLPYACVQSSWMPMGGIRRRVSSSSPDQSLGDEIKSWIPACAGMTVV